MVHQLWGNPHLTHSSQGSHKEKNHLLASADFLMQIYWMVQIIIIIIEMLIMPSPFLGAFLFSHSFISQSFQQQQSRTGKAGPMGS